MALDRLNLHHLRYFWAVAHEGNLTRAAKRLRVAPSAMSSQIRQLEQQLGEDVFRREGRQLALTEAGRIALRYADEIFAISGELATTFTEGRQRTSVLRIGAVATLSRNFQSSFIQPLLQQAGVRLRMESSILRDLLTDLVNHNVDVVLSNQRPSDSRVNWSVRRVAVQPVSLVGHEHRTELRIPDDLDGLPMILPGRDSDVRMEFDAFCARHGVAVQVLAEVEDMATMRLIAREARGVALLPSVVVRDEIHSGELQEYCVVPDLYETFYAITVDRLYQHPLLVELFARRGRDILGMETEPEPTGA